MRLPASYEWQYVAMGGESEQSYPWGDKWDASKAPTFTSGRTMPAPDDVTAHPDGASVFGVEDLWGNVYQVSVKSESTSEWGRCVLRPQSFSSPRNLQTRSGRT